MLEGEKLSVNAISVLPESQRKFSSFFTTENLRKCGLIPSGFKLPVVNEDNGLKPESEEEKDEGGETKEE